MKIKTVILFLVFFLVSFHLIWYLNGRHIINREPPGHSIVAAYQDQPFKKFTPRFRADIHEEQYLEANGFRIHMDILEKNPRNPTVVFIPGTGVFAGFYSELLEGLWEKGFNIIGFDPRGHGFSSGARGDYTINEIVDDALAVVQFARTRFGERVCIAGSSQGGIAAFYAAARDDSLKSVVCHNIAVLNGRDNLVLSKLKISETWAPFLEFIMPLYKNFAIPVSMYLDLSQEKIKGVLDTEIYLQDDPRCVNWITVRALHSLLKTDMAKSVESIMTPVMLIYSEHDAIFPYRYEELIYNRIACKKNALFLEKTGHLVTVNNVEDIVDPVARWLRSVAH